MPAAIPIVATVASAAISSNATRSAAKTQAASTDRATAEQVRQFDLQREDSAPYREAGARALGQYETQIAQPFGASEAMADPGYQFGLQQGLSALDRRVAAAGGRVSGAALKAATRYGNDYASTKFGEAYQRRQDSLNRLASLAGLGQTATANSAAAGQSSANAISSLISGQGNATAAGQVAQGNIWGGAGNQIAAMARRNPSWFGGSPSYGQAGYDTSYMRADDPYRVPGYVGGAEGE